jgi:hypothetical protein
VLASGEGRAPAGPGGRHGCMVKGQIDLFCSTTGCVSIASIFLRILHRLLVVLASRGSICVLVFPFSSFFLHFWFWSSFFILILSQTSLDLISEMAGPRPTVQCRVWGNWGSCGGGDTAAPVGRAVHPPDQRTEKSERRGERWGEGIC